MFLSSKTRRKRQNDMRIHTKLNRKQKMEIWGTKRKIEKESLREVMHERFYRTEYSYSNSYQF